MVGETSDSRPGGVITSSNRGSGVSSMSMGNGGSGVSSMSVGNGGSSITVGRGSNVVGVSHNSGGNGLLDDGLTLNSNGVGDIVGSINMDGGGHLNNLLS